MRIVAARCACCVDQTRRRRHRHRFSLLASAAPASGWSSNRNAKRIAAKRAAGRLQVCLFARLFVWPPKCPGLAKAPTERLSKSKCISSSGLAGLNSSGKSSGRQTSPVAGPTALIGVILVALQWRLIESQSAAWPNEAHTHRMGIA